MRPVENRPCHSFRRHLGKTGVWPVKSAIRSDIVRWPASIFSPAYSLKPKIDGIDPYYWWKEVDSLNLNSIVLRKEKESWPWGKRSNFQTVVLVCIVKPKFGPFSRVGSYFNRRCRCKPTRTDRRGQGVLSLKASIPCLPHPRRPRGSQSGREKKKGARKLVFKHGRKSPRAPFFPPRLTDCPWVSEDCNTTAMNWHEEGFSTFSTEPIRGNFIIDVFSLI